MSVRSCTQPCRGSGPVLKCMECRQTGVRETKGDNRSIASEMPANDQALRHAIIDAYREQLRERYLVDNVRRFEEFDPISDKKIDTLRDFFLRCIYPSAEDRTHLDDAFNHMGEIIRSPRRMAPLMRVAFRSVWRLGVMFPSAVAAGTHTLEAYLETRRLEAKMLEYAKRERYGPGDVDKREAVVQMIAHVPEEEVVRFRNEVLKLFESLSNGKLMAATVDIMENSKDLMESRPDLYHEEELAGFSLGHEVLKQGLALFRKLKPSEFPAILEGIEVVEIDWYDRIKAEAAAY